MTKASDNEFPKLILKPLGLASAPADASWKLYPMADGVYARSSNSIVGPLGAGGGAVATDAIWDAAGDLVQGTGANTAARLALGAAGKVLKVNSGATAAEWGDAGLLQTSRVSRTAGNIAVTTNTWTDVTGMTTTITTGARRCMVTVSGSWQHLDGSGNLNIDIVIDGTRVGQDMGLAITNAANGNVPLAISYMTDVLTAASHTIKLQAKATASTATIYATTTVTPLILTVTETNLTA